MIGRAVVVGPSVVCRVVARDRPFDEEESAVNLAEVLTKTAEAHPDRIAIKLDDLEISYQLLDEGTARVAGLLKSKGFKIGDSVGIMLPNVPYFPIVYYGVLRAGGVV